MREQRMRVFGDAILDAITRRIRLVTLVVLIGGISLIAAYEPSWSGTIILAATAFAAALLFAIWAWARRNARQQPDA